MRSIIFLTSTSIAVCLIPWVLVGNVLAGSGKVALTTAALSCGDPNSSDVYFDCGNGTITDNRSGLTWLKDVDCLTSGLQGPSMAQKTWDRATIEAHNLSDRVCGLTDGSRPGDWRMATIEELQRMVADGVAMGCINPALTDATGTKCHSLNPIFMNFCGFGDNGDTYWSATSDTGGGINTHAFVIDMYDGVVSTSIKTAHECLWPVRLTQGPGG